MIESKIQTLSELINSSMSGGKKDYAIKLLNSIIDKINFDEKSINFNKAKSVKIQFQHFDTFFTKCVYCLQVMGFDKVELMNYDDEALIFLMQHKHKLKKPLTAEYFTMLHQLVKYYEWTNNKKPNNLTDLYHAYTEIESNREPEL